MKSQAKPRQTNKIAGLTQAPETQPRAPRLYRLTPEGLASLRASARLVKPWTQSTGPRTPEGRARSRVNATKHGERSADAMAWRRKLAAAFAELRAHAGPDDDVLGV